MIIGLAFIAVISEAYDNTVVSCPQNYQLMILLIIISVISMILILAAYRLGFTKGLAAAPKQRKSLKLIELKRKMHRNKLLLFIEKAHKLKYKQKDIVKMMTAKGWPEDHANQFVKEYFNKIVKFPEPKKKKRKK